LGTDLLSRIHWSRDAIEEIPAREPCTENLEQGERIAALRDCYQVQTISAVILARRPRKSDCAQQHDENILFISKLL
jgi:hypothetical protein